MIYFLQSTDGGAVKIGHSTDVPARIRQLEAHYGRPLALLATMPGDRDVEREIHERFKDLRLPRPGAKGVQPEQFRPCAELMAFINRPLFVNQGDVELMPAVLVVATKAIRMSEEYAAWLEEFAKANRMTVAGFVDFMLAKEAKAAGFRTPPERIS